MMDIIEFFFKIYFEILMSIYRTFNPAPLKSLHGEVAMVVGAGRGVGKELAIHLSKLGASVACVDIDIINCNLTAQHAYRASGVAKPYCCNITDKEDVARIALDIQDELGSVTMLFHCCGVPSPRLLLDDQPDPEEIIKVTVLSHFWLSEYILPQMKQAGKGHIVLLSSVAGLSVAATGVPTSTAQFAVQGFAESLRTKLRYTQSNNIAVTLVHIYPFIIGVEAASDIRFRIPSFFGTIPAVEAAKKIVDGVRRNYMEFSIPAYLLFMGHVLRILPKKASFMLRELLDTGVDFV
ncbi:short-chain dehydrogenase/reductase family 16C member 6 isoform X2 [Lasioglossum baleicum]